MVQFVLAVPPKSLVASQAVVPSTFTKLIVTIWAVGAKAAFNISKSGISLALVSPLANKVTSRAPPALIA